MNALSINGLFFFNERAFDSICTSLKRNKGLQTIDFGNLTQAKLDKLTHVRDQKYDFHLVLPERILKDNLVKQVEDEQQAKGGPTYVGHQEKYHEPDVEQLKHSYSRQFNEPIRPFAQSKGSEDISTLRRSSHTNNDGPQIVNIKTPIVNQFDLNQADTIQKGEMEIP